MIMSIKQKKVKFKPIARIKLNHNIYIMYAVKLRKQWKDGKSYLLRICCLGPTRKSSLFGINLLFAICTSHKIHLVCPPNFCITFVFDSPWVFQWSQKNSKRMLLQNFGRQQGVLWEVCKWRIDHACLVKMAG